MLWWWQTGPGEMVGIVLLVKSVVPLRSASQLTEHAAVQGEVRATATKPEQVKQDKLESNEKHTHIQ